MDGPMDGWTDISLLILINLNWLWLTLIDLYLPYLIKWLTKKKAFYRSTLRWIKTKTVFFYLYILLVLPFLSISIIFIIFHNFETLFAPGGPLSLCFGSWSDKYLDKINIEQNIGFFFCKFQMFSSFSSFSWFLPFFTILGPYLPLVNPPTPIPAPCLHPLRQQGVRGNQHKARNGLFDYKFCLYWSISLHQWFLPFFTLFEPWLPLLEPSTPILLSCMVTWRDQ